MQMLLSHSVPDGARFLRRKVYPISREAVGKSEDRRRNPEIRHPIPLFSGKCVSGIMANAKDIEEKIVEYGFGGIDSLKR